MPLCVYSDSISYYFRYHCITKPDLAQISEAHFICPLRQYSGIRFCIRFPVCSYRYRRFLPAIRCQERNVFVNSLDGEKKERQSVRASIWSFLWYMYFLPALAQIQFLFRLTLYLGSAQLEIDFYDQKSDVNAEGRLPQRATSVSSSMRLLR